VSQKLGGNLSPKLGWEVAPDFASRFGGIEATAHQTHFTHTTLGNS